MTELTNLLNVLRQKAGLPDVSLAKVEPHVDPVGDISPRPIPAASELSVRDAVPTESDLLLGAVSAWAGGDTRRWNRLLGDLKRTWHPSGWKPETPRDLLVAWASANYRLVAAQTDRLKLEQIRSLTPIQSVTLRARYSDITFFSQLARGLKSWAADALRQDTAGFRTLERICANSAETQS